MENCQSGERINRFDNIKGVLIFLVVFGHFLEPLLSDSTAKALYVLIYSFHMPLFIFMSGYFASFKIDRVIKNILYPYIVFQSLYILFSRFVLKADTDLTFTTPYWIMWYMWALFFWTITAGMLKLEKAKLYAIFIAALIGLAAGFFKGVGYSFSLSRILVFFPYFLWGYYLKGHQGLFNKKIKPISLIAAVFVLVLTLIVSKNISVNWLYGSYPYYGAYSPVIRLMGYLTASVWILFFLSNMTNKKCFVTKIGQNTLCIYLFHGFFAKAAEKFLPGGSIVTAFAAAAVLTYVLSSDAVKRKTSALTTFPFKISRN